MVEVRGVPVLCSETKINDLLGCIFLTYHAFVDIIEKNNLDNIKRWLAPSISSAAPSWLEEGVII